MSNTASSANGTEDSSQEQHDVVIPEVLRGEHADDTQEDDGVTDGNQFDFSNTTPKGLFTRLKMLRTALTKLTLKLYSSFIELKNRQGESIRRYAIYLKGLMFASTPEEAHYRMSIAQTLDEQVHIPLKVGLIVVSIGLSFFGIWGVLAPLDTASYASGHIELTGYAKIVQHPEGGIIKEIFVKDGDYVQKGQPLIALDTRAARAKYNSILTHLLLEIATEKRLMAEMLNSDKVDFSDPLLNDPSNAEVVKVILKNQQSIFESKRKHYQENIKMLEEQENGYKNMVKGGEAVLQESRAQLRLVQKELKDFEALYAKKLIAHGPLLQRQADEHRLTGQVHQVTAQIAEMQDKVLEVTAQKSATEQGMLNRAQEEYKANHTDLLDMKANLEYAKDILNRTIIRSPSEGTVLNLVFHSKDGVISPHMKIMEIVPKDEELIAEVKVSTRDIDNIHYGSDVKLSLDAYKARLVPRITGKVIYISANKVYADRMTYGMMSAEYYVVRIRIDKDMISNLTTKVKLYPGMPVTAYIIEGTRTLMQILLSPILDSFHKAFREV